MSTESNPESVAKCLREQRPKSLCDDCIADLTGIPNRVAVQQITKSLGESCEFHREKTRCTRCELTKESITARPAPLSLADLQQLIRDRYFATDSARGIPGTFMWLIEEVGELSSALQDNAPGQSPTPEQRKNLEEEFADVLAWLTTLANIADIDLTQAMHKYTDPERVKGVKH